MKHEQVSLIIPIYNAEKYLSVAIESALHLPAVGEILLVDDGYPDNSLSICKAFVRKYEKVRLLQHRNGENRGAAASRNLGIKSAVHEFIAFLDADDFFLPNRFSKTFSVFKNDSTVSAVYEPVGTVFDNEFAKSDFAKLRKIDLQVVESYQTYLKEPLEGRDFLISLLNGNNGSPHLNGITFKRSLIERVGYFNEGLKLHQDSEYWVRAAYYGCFSFVADPAVVAMRRVHQQNRITHRSFDSRLLKDSALYEWAKKDVEDFKVLRLIMKNYAISFTFSKMNTNNIIARGLARIKYLSLLFFSLTATK